MDSPQFLVTRYANGSAGKFFLTLLMSSESVAHFDPVVEQHKTATACVNYTQSHFVSNITDWLKHEPKHSDAWNLHQISSNYPRGDSLSESEFLHIAKSDATQHFWNSVANKKLIPFIWHKSSIPEFFKHSKFITILIDPAAVKWFHRARWHKQYGLVNESIHIKERDPSYNSAKLKMYYEQFGTEYLVEQHPYSFIKQNIINDPKKKLFQTTDAFVTDSNAQEFVALSDILHVDRCINKVIQICNKFNIAPVSEQLIIDSHAHWLSCHNFKYTPGYDSL
jgi:hypothetical protein